MILNQIINTLIHNYNIGLIKPTQTRDSVWEILLLLLL